MQHIAVQCNAQSERRAFVREGSGASALRLEANGWCNAASAPLHLSLHHIWTSTAGEPTAVQYVLHSRANSQHNTRTHCLQYVCCCAAFKWSSAHQSSREEQRRATRVESTRQETRLDSSPQYRQRHARDASHRLASPRYRLFKVRAGGRPGGSLSECWGQNGQSRTEQ